MKDLSIKNLTFRYKGQERDVLSELCLTIAGGEFVALMGKSGAGKSTLIQLIAGLEQPTDGSICVGGEKVSGPSVGRAMVFQQPSLFPWLTAEGNVAFAARQANARLSRRDAREVARQALRSVNMGAYGNVYPGRLSGGMQQRVALARALAIDADVILMDEPFGALDPKNRMDFKAMLEKMVASRPRTMVFVTHDVDEALLLADRAIFLSDGRVRENIRLPLPRSSRGGDALSDPDMMEEKRKILTLFWEVGT